MVVDLGMYMYQSIRNLLQYIAIDITNIILYVVLICIYRPWMNTDNTYTALHSQLSNIPNELQTTPSSVLVITAHWVEATITVSSNDKPTMIYDYSGFPQHTYSIQYNAPGNSKLAHRVVDLLQQHNITAKCDDKRGYDHGTFTPLYVIYPQANIPIVQLSLYKSFDPAYHINVGRALKQLRNENVLIIGSGLSYHNLHDMFGGDHSKVQTASYEFDNYIHNAIVNNKAIQRNNLLTNWSTAPYARNCHPYNGEDHLLPLLVVAGASEDDNAVRCYYERDFMGYITVSSYRFGLLPSEQQQQLNHDDSRSEL